MKIIIDKEANFSLHNNENYRKELEPEIRDILKKISELFINYFKFITGNIKLTKSNFSRFIITLNKISNPMSKIALTSNYLNNKVIITSILKILL